MHFNYISLSHSLTVRCKAGYLNISTLTHAWPDGNLRMLWAFARPDGNMRVLSAFANVFDERICLQSASARAMRELRKFSTVFATPAKLLIYIYRHGWLGVKYQFSIYKNRKQPLKQAEEEWELPTAIIRLEPFPIPLQWSRKGAISAMLAKCKNTHTKNNPKRSRRRMGTAHCNNKTWHCLPFPCNEAEKKQSASC